MEYKKAYKPYEKINGKRQWEPIHTCDNKESERYIQKERERKNQNLVSVKVAKRMSRANVSFDEFHWINRDIIYIY